MSSRIRVAAVLVGVLLLAPAARAQSCFAENECTFEKPNILVIMDYSSSMVLESFGSSTRWQAQVDAARTLLQNRGLTDNMHIALARFGHDPAPAAGTTLTNDTSSPPITDGFAIDVAFDRPNGSYRDCNAAALRSALNGLPEPPSTTPYIGTWTRGALDSAFDLIQATKQSHRPTGSASTRSC
jgi:hypothetical protein